MSFIAEMCRQMAARWLFAWCRDQIRRIRVFGEGGDRALTVVGAVATLAVLLVLPC